MKIHIMVTVLNISLKSIHTLLLNFLFSDWLVSKYAECIEMPNSFEILTYTKY